MWREGSLKRKRENKILLHIGLDDIDSPEGGCTTHLASILVEKLSRENLEFVDYPNLIRLNPNIPWKTRGNGAVALRILVSEGAVSKVVDIVLSEVEKYVGEFSRIKSQPAIAFCMGEIPSKLRWFSLKAIRDVIPLSLASKIAEKANIRTIPLKGRRGIVGALAAIGEPLDRRDYTFELIAYRTREMYGKPRLVDEKSVFEMNKLFRNETFLNVDCKAGKILITPHGPDPVLLGIRGESAEAVFEAFKAVKVLEPVERWTIFRTNQATDMHLSKVNSVKEIRPYMSIVLKGRVSKEPKTVRGGHVVFSISDGEGNEVDCIAYEPTGSFRNIVKQLILNDIVKVYGGVRPGSPNHGLSINLEKLEIISLARKIMLQNPKCPKCGKRMKSAGKGKGFKCPKCGFKSVKLSKNIVEIPRSIKTGLYTPPPRAFRHLMKPLQRVGKEKSAPPEKMLSKWHHP